MTNTLTATAHFNTGLFADVPTEDDLYLVGDLHKLAIALLSFLMIVWRDIDEMQPLIRTTTAGLMLMTTAWPKIAAALLFVSSVVEAVEAVLKVVMIIWNVVRFI